MIIILNVHSLFFTFKIALWITDSKLKGISRIFQVNDYFKNVIFLHLPYIQAASQENLEYLREKNNVSIRSQMELRIEDL